ncbi:MAG TPA: hypothetical protein PKC39_06335 [Ferruginibacter sp.]|nr:hypothetical protein [Ferruginibacter sp.]HMP20555.1 hypothetical protein [Ferruginibacter sp.]
MKNAWLSLFVLLTNYCCAQVQDSIVVSISHSNAHPGDTLVMDINFPVKKSSDRTATIQLWIENVKTGRRWKYRYPLINGYVQAKLVVDSSMPYGLYAFNFLLQKKFFTLNGRLLNASRRDKKLNYMLISKDKDAVLDTAALNAAYAFSIKNLLFQDSGFIIFSRPKKKYNDLQIAIQTPLDSAFTPSASYTGFITIGSQPGSLTAKDTAEYRFKPDNLKYKIILPEVVIKSKSSRRLEEFDEENSTGMFSGQDAIILDGLSSDEIANAPDLFIYLSIKVGGLRLETDNQTGNRYFTWRGAVTDMYLNEIRLDPDIPLWINPADIAMIKIFRPGTAIAADASAGGAIAIYTKIGAYRDNNSRSYNFYVNGYTGLLSTWQ